MSSRHLRRPDFRLHLGYPEVTLLRSDIPGMTRLASPDHPAFADDLRRLAAAIEATNGRLTVVLPDREVWRDRRRLRARTPWMRQREARALAARILAVAPGDIALSIGRRGSDGATALAATRRQTLSEVRHMLAAVGLRPEMIRGAGRFDGFAAPPALGSLRWNPPGRRLPDGLPRAAVAIGGLAASIAAIVAILGARPPEPVMSQGPLIHQSVARGPVTLAAEMPPPASIPASTAPLATPTPVAPGVAKAPPPPLRQEAALPVAAPAPGYSINTRSLDVLTTPDGRPVLNLRELPGARRVNAAVQVGSDPAPAPRPTIAGAADAAPVVARVDTADDTADVALPGPLDAAGPLARQTPDPRSGAEPVAEMIRRVAIVETEDFPRPERRPSAVPGARVASLTPSDAMTVGTLAATVLAPPARPDAPIAAAESTARPPEPVARPASVPAPKLQRIAATPRPPAAAAPARTPARSPIVTAALAPQAKIVPIVPQPKSARPAPVAKVVAVAPARSNVAPKAVAERTTTARTTTARATTARTAARAGILRTQLSLVGVFGDTDAPHALVRLPSGDIQRVRTGDSVAGLQVAAVTSDGVRMRGGGSETMLRLPD